ncbi:MAG: hypothetical protein JWL94_2131 [Microbacteriaceae bacterium]|jgi:hypothetical protein|nr:hypothetical protein [Microbacteriaceae bacterium]HEV7957277.1 hypothetical protein [Marisediminicola sp.]
MTNTEMTGSLEGLFVVASAPAGWYEVAGGSRRWFDGRQWTSYYAPLESRPDAEVGARRHQTNHGFHLIMIVMTLGVWLPVWAIMLTKNVVRSSILAPRNQTRPLGSGATAPPGSSQ